MFFKKSISSENKLLATNKYTPKRIKTTKTCIKYFLVSSLVGHTTCLNSLTESLKNLIIAIFNVIKKCYFFFVTSVKEHYISYYEKIKCFY